MGALLFAPEPIAAQLTKLRASFAGIPRVIIGCAICMSLLDKQQSGMARFST